MSDQDVFQDSSASQDPATQNGAPVGQDTGQLDVFADKLSSITHPDGTPKYTDVASALDSIPHAQAHISTIEEENAQLKETLAREQAARELLAKQVGQKQEPAQPGLTAEQVEQIALEAQMKAIAANQQAANVNSVNAKFSELYGDKAVEQMQIVAQESGMSVGQIRDLAQSSPQAVFRLAGITSTDSTRPPPKTPGLGQGDNFTAPRTPEPPKSIMGGSDTKDLVANWKAAGELVKQQTQ